MPKRSGWLPITSSIHWKAKTNSVRNKASLGALAKDTLMTPNLYAGLDPCRREIAAWLLNALQHLAEGKSLGLDEAGLYSLLEKPPTADLGDYAFPCFRFAKVLGKKPQEVAEA